MEDKAEEENPYIITETSDLVSNLVFVFESELGCSGSKWL